MIKAARRQEQAQLGHELPFDPMKETFVGEAIIPEDVSFAASPMATGKPGLPTQFSWKGNRFSIHQVLEEWKEAGDFRHGSGERYVRKHWYRIKTNDGQEMKLYFERQGRSSGGSRWRLYSILNADICAASDGDKLLKQ